jgi:RHS repeat-associated protein
VATANSTQATNYSYDPWGRRMWEEIPGLRDSQNNQLTNTTCEVYFYGVTGQKLETYSCSYTGGGFVSSLEGINVYFGKKLLQSKGAWVVTDKLGTVRANASLGAMNYFPYGEERTSTANDVEKFGTYTRDAVGQDYAQQRYYNSSVGAFWTPDPGGIRTVNPSNPNSWNRYAYVNGDPANHSDPVGMEQDLCGPDWETDPSLEGPCCDPSQNGFLGAAPDPACYAGGGGDAPAPPPPSNSPCWQNTGNISTTLGNLGTDVETDVASQFSGADLQLLTSDINLDIASEMSAIGGGTTSSPYYIGGHFNLNIPDSQVAQFSTADQTAFASDFAGTSSDGVRQAASTGLAATLGYTLHSQNGKIPGDYSFHFDRFNRNSGLAGAVGHGVYDWLGGHLGHPCLDPAWHK